MPAVKEHIIEIRVAAEHEAMQLKTGFFFEMQYAAIAPIRTGLKTVIMFKRSCIDVKNRATNENGTGINPITLLFVERKRKAYVAAERAVKVIEKGETPAKIDNKAASVQNMIQPKKDSFLNF